MTSNSIFSFSFLCAGIDDYYSAWQALRAAFAGVLRLVSINMRVWSRPSAPAAMVPGSLPNEEIIPVVPGEQFIPALHLVRLPEGVPLLDVGAPDTDGAPHLQEQLREAHAASERVELDIRAAARLTVPVGLSLHDGSWYLAQQWDPDDLNSRWPVMGMSLFLNPTRQTAQIVTGAHSAVWSDLGAQAEPIPGSTLQLAIAAAQQNAARLAAVMETFVRTVPCRSWEWDESADNGKRDLGVWMREELRRRLGPMNTKNVVS